MMNSEMISVIVRSWHDLKSDATQLRAVRVDTSEEIHLSDGSFLLRISTEADPLVLRCFIRHLASGREAFIQGGANLRSFVESCLLEDGKSVPESTRGMPQEETMEDAPSGSEPQSPDSQEPRDKLGK